jgi:hypothetical protein
MFNMSPYGTACDGVCLVLTASGSSLTQLKDCSMCLLGMDDYREEMNLNEDLFKLRHMHNVKELRRVAVEEHRWPGCDEDPKFILNQQPFVAMKFWDDEGDTVLIQTRREAAEKALGFRLNRNALFNIGGFDMCLMVSFILFKYDVFVYYMSRMFAYDQF